MSQFDVHPNPSRVGRDDRPFVLVVQTRFLDHLKTRVCAPLVEQHAFSPQGRLNPLLRVKNHDYYFSPTELLALPARVLGKPVGNLEAQRDRIVAALDMVFTGI